MKEQEKRTPNMMKVYTIGDGGGEADAAGEHEKKTSTGYIRQRVTLIYD